MLEQGLEVYLIDGTYELFRHYYAPPSARHRDGREVAAVRGVLASVLGMIQGGATHIAVATDHVIESFRNGLWRRYKTGEGIEPELRAQFPLLEEILSAAGVVVWPMVEFEADDALAAAAAAVDRDARVDRVIVCTPDKDLAQCVRGERVVQLNRRTRVTFDEAGVIRKFGVAPESIPDYLALVGDSADGYPGLPGWGAKSTAAVIAKFGHTEGIPTDASDWKVDVANARALAATLSRERRRSCRRFSSSLLTSRRISTNFLVCYDRRSLEASHGQSRLAASPSPGASGSKRRSTWHL
jgi:5'-3' exonuclease